MSDLNWVPNKGDWGAKRAQELGYNSSTIYGTYIANHDKEAEIPISLTLERLGQITPGENTELWVTVKHGTEEYSAKVYAADLLAAIKFLIPNAW